jgi:hypothetical protein
VDIYLIWNIILLIIGVRTGDGLSRGKAVGGVLITILIVLIFQVLLAFGTATQAAEAFRLWTGLTAPLEVMKIAVQR